MLTFFVYVLYSADSKERPELIREKRASSYKIVLKGYSVDLDCRFKDPYSLDNVTLSKGLVTQTPRKVDGVKITNSGQMFTINDFQLSDSGNYRCKVGPWSSSIGKLYLVFRAPSGMNYLL